MNLLNYNLTPGEPGNLPDPKALDWELLYSLLEQKTGLSRDRIKLVKGDSKRVKEELTLSLDRALNLDKAAFTPIENNDQALYLHWHLRFWDPAMTLNASLRICDSIYLCGIEGFSLVLLAPEMSYEPELPSPLLLQPLLESLSEEEPLWDQTEQLRDYTISMLQTEVPDVKILETEGLLPNSFKFIYPGVSPMLLEQKLALAGISLYSSSGLADTYCCSIDPRWDLEYIDGILALLVPALRNALPEGKRLAAPEFSMDQLKSGSCGGGCGSSEGACGSSCEKDCGCSLKKA